MLLLGTILTEKVRYVEPVNDKPTPKYRTDFIVRDRELGKDYKIIKFSYHQLNGNPWYYAVNLATNESQYICENWLTLVKRCSL